MEQPVFVPYDDTLPRQGACRLRKPGVFRHVTEAAASFRRLVEQDIENLRSFGACQRLGRLKHAEIIAVQVFFMGFALFSEG